MKHFFKLLAIVVLSVIGAVGVGIGILYLSGGFDAKVVEPTDIAFVEDRIMTYGPTDLKVETTTEEVDPNCELTITALPRDIVKVPNKVKINQRFVVWPVIDTDGENVGGKVTITASYKGQLVTECKVFIDVEVKSIQVSMTNANAKWGETVNFTTQVFPQRALNPNDEESTAGTSWEDYGSKTIFYYLVDADDQPLETKYAEFIVGTELVGSTISSKDIEEAKQEGKPVAIKTKNNESTNPVTFYIKAFVYSTYSEQAKYQELDQSEQIANMILDTNSNPESEDYRKQNHVTLTNFEIDGMESSLYSSDPDNLKVVEVYLYEETVFVANMKTTTSSDLRKDLDISLYTDTPGADTSIIDFFIRDNVTLSIDDTSYFSFGEEKDGEGRYHAVDGGETSDYWTWKLVWNTPDIANYEALGKEFVITVQYADSETIKFSFKLRVIDRQSSSLTYETDTENNYFSVKSGEELKIFSSYFKVNPDDATFDLVKVYLTSLRNTIRYVPEVGDTTYYTTFAFYKERAEKLGCDTINGADSLGNTIKYFSSPDFAEGTAIDDIDTYVGYVYAKGEYSRGLANASSAVPIRIYYVDAGTDLEIHNIKFYAPSLSGYEETPFLKVNGITVTTDFDVVVDDYDNIYILVKSSDNRLVFGNIGTVVATAQVVYCDKDGRGIVNAFGEYVWTDTTVSFDIEIYDEVSELSFFSENAITDVREGVEGITGTSISETENIQEGNYILEEDRIYYVYVKSPNSEALDLAVDGVGRTNITITPFYRSELESKPYYEALTTINQDAVTYDWERRIVGTEYGYRIRFMLDNCYKIEIEGEEVLDIIYKIEITVDDCKLVGYFKVIDNIIESADIKYNEQNIDKTAVSSDIESYITSDGANLVLKAYNSVIDNDTNEIIAEGGLINFDNLTFTLNMADGTETVATMRYDIENLTKSVSINNLIYFSNGKLVVKNVPYVEGGVKIKVSISSEGFTGLNSFYKLSGSSFVLSKEDATAEFTLIIHGLQINITKNEEAPVTVKGVKLSTINLAVADGENFNRLIFEIKDKADEDVTIDVSKVIDFVLYSGTSEQLYAISGSVITILDDISASNNILVYFYIGDNTITIDGGSTSYTIFIDPIFRADIVDGKDTIDAPLMEEKITDTIVNVLRNDEDLSSYTNFYVEYVLDSTQEGYENLTKYVEFVRTGVNSYINVSNIPADFEIDVKLTIYEALGNTYTVEYQGTTYTQKKGFYTGNYEFPVSNYTYEDVAVDGSRISYTESKEGATKVNLAEITKEYRVEYNDMTFVYDGAGSFYCDGYELPLRDYSYVMGEDKLYHKASSYDVRAVYSISYPKVDSKKYYYDEEAESFFNETEGEIPAIDYIIDWDNMQVKVCGTEATVSHDPAIGFTVDIGGIIYTYVEAKNDFFNNAQSLKEMYGYYYWDKSPANYQKLYYIGLNDTYTLDISYVATKGGADYIYNEANSNFYNPTDGSALETTVSWNVGDEKVYYTGAEDFVPVTQHFVATYLGEKYTYVNGFFDEEGNELSTVIGAYTWTEGDSTLNYNDGEAKTLNVLTLENKKQIATTVIKLNLHNIYTDRNLSLGQKYDTIIALNDGAYSFEFDGETYFYNKDTEEFMTSNGRAFVYEITSWENGVITYINADDAEHTLNVVVDGDEIKITYDGVDYVYSDTFVTKEDVKFPYELTTDYITNEDAIIVKYHVKKNELTILNDGTDNYIELAGYDADINGKYIYDATDVDNPVFKTTSGTVFPFYIIPGYSPTVGSTVYFAMNRIPVTVDGENITIEYNGRTFKYNPGSGQFISSGKYIFGLQTDVTHINDGYITVMSETVDGVNDAQLGFIYLFENNGELTATIGGVEFVYQQNFYNIVGGAKFPTKTTVDLVNNKVTFDQTTVDLLSSATYKYFTYGGSQYKYVPELVVKIDTKYPGAITSVDTANPHDEAIGYVNGSIDLFEESEGVYYIKKVIIDDFAVKYYYKKVFVSTDGYNTEFEFEIDYNKTNLTNGGKLYYTDASDASHTIDVVTGKLPLKYYIVYNVNGGNKNFYYNAETGDFVNEGEGSISTVVNITGYSLFDRTITGSVLGTGETYNGEILVENNYTSTHYVENEDGDKYYFEANYNDGAVYDAFVLRNPTDSSVIEVYKIVSINKDILTYCLPLAPAEKFTTTIYKQENYDVTIAVAEVEGTKYIFKNDTFVSLDNDTAFPYTITYIDFVRNKLTYGAGDVVDILIYIPETYVEYEGKTYYYFLNLGREILLDRDCNKFAFEFSDDAINLENKEFSYVKYENHIVAGLNNGAMINLDGLYTVVVEGVRYRYNGTTFVDAQTQGAFPYDIITIDLVNFELVYRNVTDFTTTIYGKYDSFTVAFEDVEGVDFSTNTNAANHMRFDPATRVVSSYDLNCDKDVWVVVTVNFADGGTTVIRKKVTVVQNLFIGMNENTTFEVASNPRGMLLTNDSYYTNTIYEIDQYGGIKYLNPSEYIEYDSFNIPTNEFSIAESCKQYATITIADDTPYLSPINSAVTNDMVITVIYSFYIKTNNSGYYLDYNFNVKLIKK